MCRMYETRLFKLQSKAQIEIWWHSSYERILRRRKTKAWKIQSTFIKSFRYFCRPQRIVGQKVSTNCRMAVLPDCFHSSSCLLLREYWNLVPNNTNICVKKWRCDYHSRLGVHFPSHNTLCAQQRKLIDACFVGKLIWRSLLDGYYTIKVISCASRTLMTAKRSFKKLASRFCNHSSIFPSRLCCEMFTKYPEIKLVKAVWRCK